MNQNLTINTLAFILQNYSDKGSLRREISRGMALPTTLKIAHTPYVDSGSKKPGVRSMVRFDRYQSLTDGSIGAPECHVVVARPTDVLVTGAVIIEMIELLVALLQEDDGGLNLAEEIFVNQVT